jgi:hypothetical protein
MGPLGGLAFVILAVLSLRGVRWAYVTFIVLGLAYFPVRAGFDLDPRACQLAFSGALAVYSLTNVAHIVLFAIFFLMSAAQFADFDRAALARAALLTLAMGALVELAEGVSGRGNCRLRDLVPDSAGVALGATTLALWRAVRRRAFLRANDASR